MHHLIYARQVCMIALPMAVVPLGDTLNFGCDWDCVCVTRVREARRRGQ